MSDRHGEVEAEMVEEVAAGRQAEAQALDIAGSGAMHASANRPAYAPRPRPLPSLLSEGEAARHAAFVRDVLKAEALWAA